MFSVYIDSRVYIYTTLISVTGNNLTSAIQLDHSGEPAGSVGRPVNVWEAIIHGPASHAV